MYTISLSQDGINYISWFKQGKLRQYTSIKLAQNALYQIANNPKNKLYSAKIMDSSTKLPVMAVTVKDGKPQFKEITPSIRSNTVPIDSLISIKDCHTKLVEKPNPPKKQEIKDHSEFTAKVLEAAMMMKDYQTILKIQLDLLSKGLFWSTTGKTIEIKPINQVIEEVKERTK